MAKASTSRNDPTIRPDEAEHFGRLAADWWNPRGSSAMLHRLNPVRLGFVRQQLDRHLGSDERALKPLAGKRVLDVGCGAGLLCEPLARLGGDVTGVDAAPENIAAARAHAAGQGLSIRYHAGELAELDAAPFDVVTCMEVIEHVADPAAFLDQLIARVAAGGLLLLSTPNRTPASRLLLVGLAEATGRIPRGTHDWDSFVTPDELTALLEQRGWTVTDLQGIAFDPMQGLHLSGNMALNYILAAVRV